jgi:hypothetical protein
MITLGISIVALIASLYSLAKARESALQAESRLRKELERDASR